VKLCTGRELFSEAYRECDGCRVQQAGAGNQIRAFRLTANEQTYVMMELKGNSIVIISFNKHDYNHKNMSLLPLSPSKRSTLQTILSSPIHLLNSKMILRSHYLYHKYSFLRWSLQAVEGRQLISSKKR
jgi:hypothetical protein